MIYNVANTLDIGQEVVLVVDAAGKTYYRDLLEVNTETGRMVRRKRDSFDDIPVENGHFVNEIIHVPAPVKVFFKGKEA